jgi:hypothetical protein
VFLTPEKADQNDANRWPDRRDVDTTGMDMQQLGLTDPNVSSPMNLSLSVNESDDFFTIGEIYGPLVDTMHTEERQNILNAFLTEVGQGGKKDTTGLKADLPNKMGQVNGLLAQK